MHLRIVPAGMERVEKYVANINENLDTIRTRGPYSKYRLDMPEVEIKAAKLELTWGQSKDAALL